jgi:hypothetical protein
MPTGVRAHPPPGPPPLRRRRAPQHLLHWYEVDFDYVEGTRLASTIIILYIITFGLAEFRVGSEIGYLTRNDKKNSFYPLHARKCQFLPGHRRVFRHSRLELQV